MIKNIFKDSISQLKKAKFILPCIGIFIGLFSLLYSMFKGEGIKLVLSVIYSIIILVGFSLFIYLTYFIYLYSKRYNHYKVNHYGEIILKLNTFFSKIHLIRTLDYVDVRLLKSSLQTMCDDLKEIYDKKTHSTCCVSIKLFEQLSEDGVVDTNASLYNISRDNNSQDTRDTEIYRNIKHTVFMNTPFSHITERILSKTSKGLFYINNNIDCKDVNYKNSSKGAYPNGILPYRSEIVAPLIQISGEANNAKVLGFICIDSDKPNSFGTKYDIPMLQGVADGIHDVIMEWKFNSK